MTVPVRPSPTSRFALSSVLVALLSCMATIAAASPPVSARAPESGQGPAVLAGLWELDPEQSDDPAEVMRRAAAEAEEQGGRRGGRGFGGPPGGRGGMGRGSTGGGPGGGRLLALPELLEIEADARELKLVLDERVQIFYLDGEEHAREDGRGGRMTTVAEFRGGIARVREERELPFGKLELFRTLQATNDVLVVRTELKMPRRGDSVVLRSVYRRLD